MPIGVYDRELLTPFRSLVDALSPAMLMIDPQFETRPAIGKTLSRIHRDTRFSHDKSRYRSRMWLTFKRPSKDWKLAPVYFFELGPDMLRYGLGYYSADKATMDLFAIPCCAGHRRFWRWPSAAARRSSWWGKL